MRLLKWWRCVKQCETASEPLSDVASFLVNLLAAYAFDARGVQASYAATIADWLGHLARVVAKRTVISFNDYLPSPSPSATAQWSAYDPLNRENNVVAHWRKLDADEFADWLSEARDHLYEAISAFDGGRESAGMDVMAKVLGTAFLNHSEPAP